MYNKVMVIGSNNTKIGDGTVYMKLTAQLLVNAYCQGIFPMADADDTIYWYDPDPRTILPLDKFHVPRSLARKIQRGNYEVRYDTAFRVVMEACAEPAPGRETTWINSEMIDRYSELQKLGFAHSVEIWMDGQLAGGLYGVSVRGLFAGESMFSRATDSSKIALVHLVEKLRRGGYTLLDVQFMTNHLRRFGAVEISREDYKSRLAHALTVTAQFR